MLIVSDLKGNIIHCNKALVDKLGYSLLELKAMNSIQLHPIEKREETYEIVEKLIKKEIDYFPLDVVAKSGNIYSLETIIWMGKWDGQDCLFSTSKDITKENENLQLFFKIFENNPLAMSINTIEESEFIRINSVFSEIIGYSKEEVIDKTIYELDIFNDYNEFNSIKNKIFKNGNIKNHELILKSKNGSLINGLFSIELINIEGKKSILIVMADITKEREQSLELESFFSVNLDLLCIADMEGNFIKTNKAWEDILGYKSSELKGRQFLEFVHPEDIKKH